MNTGKLTLGQSIDQIVSALDQLDPAMRKTALEAVCMHLNIKLTASSAPIPTTPFPSHNPASPSPISSGLVDQGQSRKQQPSVKADIRSLKEEKRPDSAYQMACLVAYYLKELASEDERKETVSAMDLEKYFKQANFKLPKRMQQVLVDAKGAGYFDSGTQRGEYKLNAVGHNLVAHNLPKSNGEN